MAAKPEIIESAQERRIVSREELAARLQDRAWVILNVMPKATFDGGHIPGSVNLPVADLNEKARQTISNLSQEIAIYCMGPT